MWLVDLAPDGRVTAERIDCPVPRRLARLRGRLDDLLADPALDHHEDAWVEAVLTDPVRPAEPMARLARRFPTPSASSSTPSAPTPPTTSSPTPAACADAPTSRSRRTS